MVDMRMMLCIINPPHKGKLPFSKNYFKIACLFIDTLIRTGFPKEKIICISADKRHVKKFETKFGVRSEYCEAALPKEFRKWTTKNDQHFYFYKSMAFRHVIPKPINDDTVMAFADVDQLWQKSPYELMVNQEVDVWAQGGNTLPRRKPNASKRYNRWRNGTATPSITLKDLSEYYHRAGWKATAEVHLKYNFPLPGRFLYTGMVAIKPHVYEKLIKTWYEMAIYGAHAARKHKMPEIGDQEFFSTAIWHLNLSYTRAYKEIGGYVKHYGGDRKNDMKKDYKKFCKRIKWRQDRLEKKRKRLLNQAK